MEISRNKLQCSVIFTPLHSEYLHTKQQKKSGRNGTLGCILHWSAKFYNHVVLFVEVKLWGLLNNV